MTTDLSEKGLEAIIADSLTRDGGWTAGTPTTFDRVRAFDPTELMAFIMATQSYPAVAQGLDVPGKKREDFLDRVQSELAKRGVADVLRKGVKHGPGDFTLYFPRPTPGNVVAAENHALNRFTVVRQLRYSPDQKSRALDLALLLNGLPIATFELKNHYTKQNVRDAIRQYQLDRDPTDTIFQMGRCLVHFAVDDREVMMCPHLRGKESWFLPFNRGFNDGAGNPPNPKGTATDYLWCDVLTRPSVCELIESYAWIVEEEDRHEKKTRKPVFPRYHQRDAVRALLADAATHGGGQRYLVQHSAGSGKSNTITWLVHQLLPLKWAAGALFDSVIVVTDRRVLDDQLKKNIKQFAHVSSLVGHAENSEQLREHITEGKRIIITTVQKFPIVLDQIGSEHRGRRFAIVIDEAHSSQGGRTMAKMHLALNEAGVTKPGDEDEDSYEDLINEVMSSRKMLSNASYFAFTATPKNKTLEMFGIPFVEGGETKYRPFHAYTMKQAIEEGFIKDVLANYTPVQSWYKIAKTVADDPQYDAKQATKKLRRYVEGHETALRKKAEIMIDHFHEEVLDKKKLGGRARAMVVCAGIKRAIAYKKVFDAYLIERKSPWKSIVAFSGEHDIDDDEAPAKEDGSKATRRVDEAGLNGFPSSKIPERFASDKFAYRFLICADKFQTGFDEPLLHTMYVDKPLAGPKAVQTLSRLNRAHPEKRDCFVLDFMNDEDTIRDSFAPYYRTTILSGATDANKLHDLKADLDGVQVYSDAQVKEVVRLYLTDKERPKIDAVLDPCVEVYKQLDEQGQVDFKAKAKAFTRTYSFLATVLPYTNATWEELSTLLEFLTSRLPAPAETDLSQGVLDAIDMESYRAERLASLKIALDDKEGSVDPVPVGAGGAKPESKLDLLSNIIREFNERFGKMFQNPKVAEKSVTEILPELIKADKAFQNAAANSDARNARLEHDRALKNAMRVLLKDNSELVKQFYDNESFRTWVSDMLFNIDYDGAA